MATEAEHDFRLEIAHVLFIDIVGYSKLPINEQSALVKQLNQFVRSTEQFRSADAARKLIRIATGDGMALAFFTTPDAPVRCAIALSKANRESSALQLRMGIHSGPVDRLADVNERSNLAGAGMNMAQRVMDCGDAGHILLSRRIADDLGQYTKWQPHLHDLGPIEVKHGAKIDIVNFYSDDFGNPALPEKFKQAESQRSVTAKADRKRTFRKRGARMVVAGFVLALLLAVAFWVLERRAEQTAREHLAEIPEKSVAVLPFENLSQEPANAFFATGIQDEIITRLAKIRALKVISRTSTAQYGSRPGNLAQIAKELGVAAILEGSVQKVGNQIRVNVQLIKAATEAHLWADIYDRELIDILKVESDVATEIATALRATLTPDEKARVEKKPTNNPEAYALYLRAIEAANRAVGSSVSLEEAQHLCEQAIALDPSFALARARLSRIHSQIFQTYQPLEVHRQSSKTEAEEALRLQPNLSEAHVAMGAYFGRVERDYTKALKEYEIAKKATPNDSLVLTSTGFIRMRQGFFRQAIVDLESASSIDPRNNNVFDTLGNAYFFVKNWSAAERAKKRAAELTAGPSPGKFNEELSWAWSYSYLTGSLEKVDAVLASGSTDPKDDPAGLMASLRFYSYLVERKFGEAERAMTGTPVTIFEQWNGPRVTKNYFLGCIAMVQGDKAKAKPLFERELQFARSELNESPDSANRHAQVGLLCAYLGQKEEAISEGKHAVDLLPVSKDAFAGPWLLYNLAEIYGRVGEQNLAIDLVEQLLTIPGGLTLAELKRDFQWDPLRKNPRFQKILAGPEPKVIYN